jgi:iron complex outermembrane receptor protein
VLTDGEGKATIRVDSATVEANLRLGNGLLTSVTGYRDVFESSYADFDGTNFPLVLLAVRFNAEQFSQELRYAGNVADWLSFTVGAYYFDIEHGHREGRSLFNGALVSSFGNGARQKSKAIFGEADIKLPYGVTLTMGGRYTDENVSARQRPFSLGCPLPPTGANRYRVLTLPCDLGPEEALEFDDFSPKVGVSWKPGDDHLLYGTVSTGFRSGGFSLRGSALTPPFGEEEVTAYELGYKGALLDDRLRLNLALFRNDYEDLQRTIVFFSPQFGSLQITGNAASARIQGGEVEIVAEPFPGFVLTGAYGYTDADFKSFVGLDVTGDGVPDPELAAELDFVQVPKHSGSASANYTLPVTKKIMADLRIAMTFQSGYWFDDLNTFWEPGYAKFDASLTLRDDDDGWKAALFVRNIGNEQFGYWGSSNAVIGRLVFPTPPRTYGLQLSYSY